jgi:hypothetical protein
MKKQLIFLIVISLFSVFVVWLPFLLNFSPLLPESGYHGGLSRVIENYDGPNYLIIAKTLYQSSLITQFETMPHDVYFPAHLPLFPLLVRATQLIVPGYKAGLLVILASQLFMVFFIYRLSRLKLSPNHAFWITLLAMFIPFRWWAVRSIISPEPLFVGSIVASIFFFKQKKYLQSGIFGFLAQITKSPGIFLFFAYLVYFVVFRKRISKKHLWLLLIPLGGLAVFTFYWLQAGNFWAYFSSPDIPIHIFPFISMLKNGMWIEEFWLEEFLWLWLLSGMGIYQLFKKGLKIEGVFSLIFFIPTLFLLHRDIARYSLPIWPIILTGCPDIFKQKAIKIILVILLIPAYFYTIKFIFYNYQPISNWAPFL